jgi:hypothetical protein
MSDRASSAAFLALPKSAKKVLAAIEAAIGNGDCATISYTDFMFTHHVGRPSISAGLKQLIALGLIDVEAGRRASNVFRLSNRWRAIGEAEAARLSKEARKVLPQRRHEKRRVPVGPPKPVKVIEPVETVEPVQFMERRPSMPSLAWLR